MIDQVSAPYRAFLASASTWPEALVGHGRAFFRFGLVGCAGVLVNSGLLYLLVAGARWPHLPAAALSTEGAILGNFALNDSWTFRAARPRGGRLFRLGRYNMVSLGGLVITLMVLAILSLGMGIYYLVANVVGVAVATLWNYAVNLRCTWALHRPRLQVIGQSVSEPSEPTTLGGN